MSTSPDNPKLRWCQFSLQKLFLLLTLFSVLIVGSSCFRHMMRHLPLKTYDFLEKTKGRLKSSTENKRDLIEWFCAEQDPHNETISVRQIDRKEVSESLHDNWATNLNASGRTGIATVSITN